MLFFLLDATKETKDETKEMPEKSPYYKCIICHNVIAHEKDLIRIGESPFHVFKNPAGILFPVLTLQHAESLLLEGENTAEYSWFPGYFWRIAKCASCYVQLGWRYETSIANQEPGHFFGLIQNMLIQ